MTAILWMLLADFGSTGYVGVYVDYAAEADCDQTQVWLGDDPEVLA